MSYTRRNPAPPEPCRVLGCPNDWKGYGSFAYLCTNHTPKED